MQNARERLGMLLHVKVPELGVGRDHCSIIYSDVLGNANANGG